MENPNSAWDRLEARLSGIRGEKRRSDLKFRLQGIVLSIILPLSNFFNSLDRIDPEKTFGEVLSDIKGKRTLLEEMMGWSLRLRDELKDKIRSLCVELGDELNSVERLIYEILRAKYMSNAPRKVVDVFTAVEGEGPSPWYLAIENESSGPVGFSRIFDKDTLAELVKNGFLEIQWVSGPGKDMGSYLYALRPAIVEVLKGEEFRKAMKEQIGQGLSVNRDVKGWPIVTNAIIYLYCELLPFYSPTQRRYGFKRKGKMDVYHGELMEDILDILKDAFPKRLAGLKKQDIAARIQHRMVRKPGISA